MFITDNHWGIISVWSNSTLLVKYELLTRFKTLGLSPNLTIHHFVDISMVISEIKLMFKSNMSSQVLPYIITLSASDSGEIKIQLGSSDKTRESAAQESTANG